VLVIELRNGRWCSPRSLLGKSGGALLKPKVIALHAPPDHVMAADLNGDSRVDLVTVSFERRE